MLFEYNDINDNLEGFYKGNMFESDYIPYKNYKVNKPKCNNELLLKLMASSFAINDYNLYLDLHPNDQNYLNKFKKEIINFNNLVCEYEKKYGSLNIEHIYDNFNWVNSPWPWDTKEDKYV